MDRPNSFSNLSMFSVFLYFDVAFIKMSQATDNQLGQAMQLDSGKPALFGQEVEVIPLPY